MSIATGVAKRLAYKAESTWGTAAGASGAQYLRRVTSNIGLQKDVYESNELRRDYQRADMRHGMRRVGGSMTGELSAGTWEDFMAAVVRKLYAAVSDITGMSITIAASGSYYTVTRASGSFLTGGIKVGDVVRLTAGSFTTINLNNNLLVLAATATVLTVTPLNGSSLTAEGPIASATLSVPGKKTYVPASSHTDTSFTIEHWFSDIAQSEYFTGCKLAGMNVNLPPTGIATVEFPVIGKNVVTGTSEYFSSPTAETTSGVLAAVNGVLIAQGATLGLITGASLSVAGNMTPAGPVVGANTMADVIEGRVIVNGQVTCYFQDATFRDYFLNETEVAIALALTDNSDKDADFVAFSLPKVKFGAGAPDDGEKGLILTMPFSALYNGSGGSGTSSEATTLVIQDSLA